MLQGLDASGKDGVIRGVFKGVNPMGVQVISFRAPTEKEPSHDYLWRVHGELLSRGHVGVFNRSHYEDVVAVRMHALAPERSGDGARATSANGSGCWSTRAPRS